MEFPLVLLAGMEEGLFPHSRTLNDPNQMEEERRLYVGMTRAMDTLIVTRARYRRRYGNDMPEASLPSRFLEEIPPDLIEDMSPVRSRTQSWSGGNRDWNGRGRSPYGDDDMESGRHYSYEDEDQSARLTASSAPGSRYSGGFTPKPAGRGGGAASGGAGSLDNIAQFFTTKGKGGYTPRPKLEIPSAAGATGLRR